MSARASDRPHLPYPAILIGIQTAIPLATALVCAFMNLKAARTIQTQGHDGTDLQGQAIPEPPIQKPTEKDFIVDGTRNLVDALGLIKDWVTALIGIETASIGAIGALVINAPAVSLSIPQKVLVILAAAALTFSTVNGSLVLYMLPGCAQRTPKQEFRGRDLFSMVTLGTGALGTYARRCWVAFEAGIVIFALFLLVRLFGIA